MSNPRPAIIILGRYRPQALEVCLDAHITSVAVVRGIEMLA